MVCLHGKITVLIADVFVAVTTNIHNKVSFNVERFKNFSPFSSLPFATSGAQLKKQVIGKITKF